MQVNRVSFAVPAFKVTGGQLVLKAAYEIDSPDRVTIKLTEATLVSTPSFLRLTHRVSSTSEQTHECPIVV